MTPGAMEHGTGSMICAREARVRCHDTNRHIDHSTLAPGPGKLHADGQARDDLPDL